MSEFAYCSIPYSLNLSPLLSTFSESPGPSRCSRGAVEGRQTETDTGGECVRVLKRARLRECACVRFLRVRVHLRALACVSVHIQATMPRLCYQMQAASTEFGAASEVEEGAGCEGGRTRDRDR